MSRWARFRRCAAHQGQSLVIIALANLVLLGALGLVLDAGYDFTMRRAMQNAADTAALSGVKALTENTSSFGILDTVTAVAAQNGVTDPARLTCRVLKNDLSDYGPCTNTPYALGTNASAVRVSVSETHQTFVMRALGIATSGTAATATAQVTLLVRLPNNQAPFIPCGIQTAVVDENGNITGYQDILQTSGTYTYGTGLSAVSYAATLETPGEGVKIADSAYAFNTVEDAPNLNAGPRFLLHKGSGSAANGIQRCNTGSSSWKGFNGSITGYIDLLDNYLQFQGGGDYSGANPSFPGAYKPDSVANNGPGPSTITSGKGGIAQAGQGNQVGPASNVPGAGGCKAGVDPNNCVLILPIVDNSVQGTNGTNNYVAVRMYAAFFITSNNNGGEHYGQIIHHYPPNLTGSPVYTVGADGIKIYGLVQ
jgi:Flp pilus assembly protein TadG